MSVVTDTVTSTVTVVVIALVTRFAGTTVTAGGGKAIVVDVNVSALSPIVRTV